MSSTLPSVEARRAVLSAQPAIAPRQERRSQDLRARLEPSRTRLPLAGFAIRNTTRKAALRLIAWRRKAGLQTTVLFANANLVTTCRHLRAGLANPDVLLLNDGIALDAAAWLRHGAAFRENLNGTDFTPALLAALEGPTRVFLLGAAPGVADAAARVFARVPHVEIVGTADGYGLWSEEADTIASIRAARPDILLVALGNPLQEEWILRNREGLAVPLVMGVGALFDFVSGAKPRAPESIRRLRLEWAHRLALEPRRLAARYTIGIVRFLAAVFLDRDAPSGAPAR